MRPINKRDDYLTEGIISRNSVAESRSITIIQVIVTTTCIVVYQDLQFPY